MTPTNLLFGIQNISWSPSFYIFQSDIRSLPNEIGKHLLPSTAIITHIMRRSHPAIINRIDIASRSDQYINHFPRSIVKQTLSTNDVKQSSIVIILFLES